ncbi:MAG TPA: MAPEG family protein [Usitatibacter sp.]|jgi:hypothetical protein|nr:MAPEG family protein [Usitatibacter sp.]
MPLNPVYILYPVCALVLLTFLVLMIIPFRRFRAGFAGKVTLKDFRNGESANVPPDVSIPNRNYMNLLESPVLFYVACVVIYAAQLTTPGMVALAWAYVALRVVHSIVHMTYNNVRHRLAVFAASNVVLAILWVRLASAL